MMKKQPMIRKQLYIEADQNSMLRDQAEQYGVSEGQIVREAISKFLTTSHRPQEIDLSAWEEELRFIRTRCSKSNHPTPTNKSWRREDLYER